MEPIYRALRKFVEAGEAVAVATITEVRGSVPREVGAKMIIHPLGRHVGTIGGGCGEGDVIRAAMDVLQTGEPQNVHVDLTEDISLQALGVCGGIMNVFVERVLGTQGGREAETQGAWLEELAAAMERGESAALVTVIRGREGGMVGEKRVVWGEHPKVGSATWGELGPRVLADAVQVLQTRQHQTLRYPEHDLEVFVEVQRRPPQLIIVGAGHIAAPLCELGALCDFGVTVIDDRPQFANAERFPRAGRVIAAGIRETVRDMAMDADTFVVLVTRGHSLDVECLLEILDRPLAYIGMIGSQRRVRAVFDLLEREQGIPRAKLDRVYAPIGLPIGAQTPAEIAVCIMAEIINVFRGGSAASIADLTRRITNPAKRSG